MLPRDASAVGALVAVVEEGEMVREGVGMVVGTETRVVGETGAEGSSSAVGGPGQWSTLLDNEESPASRVEAT